MAMAEHRWNYDFERRMKSGTGEEDSDVQQRPQDLDDETAVAVGRILSSLQNIGRDRPQTPRNCTETSNLSTVPAHHIVSTSHGPPFPNPASSAPVPPPPNPLASLATQEALNTVSIPWQPTIPQKATYRGPGSSCYNLEAVQSAPSSQMAKLTYSVLGAMPMMRTQSQPINHSTVNNQGRLLGLLASGPPAPQLPTRNNTQQVLLQNILTALLQIQAESPSPPSAPTANFLPQTVRNPNETSNDQQSRQLVDLVMRLLLKGQSNGFSTSPPPVPSWQHQTSAYTSDTLATALQTLLPSAQGRPPGLQQQPSLQTSAYTTDTLVTALQTLLPSAQGRLPRLQQQPSLQHSLPGLLQSLQQRATLVSTAGREPAVAPASVTSTVNSSRTSIAPLSSSRTASSHSSTSPTFPNFDTQPRIMYLATDDELLSPYQCLVRQQIEIFEATHADVYSSAQGRNRPIVLGQVGIRCRHCGHLPAERRARGSVYFPSTLLSTYQVSQNMANTHLLKDCPAIPPSIREDLRWTRLRSNSDSQNTRKSSFGAGRTYWARTLQMEHNVVEMEDKRLRFVSKSGSSSSSSGSVVGEDGTGAMISGGGRNM